MKNPFQLILFILLAACQPEDKVEEKKYCSQEKKLIKGNSSFEVLFDFNLSYEEQIEHLQSQVDVSLCEGIIPLNGTFEFDNSKIETLLMVDWYCAGCVIDLKKNPPTCILIRSKSILINSSGQILLDGDFVKIDSISNLISKLSKDFFWDNEYPFVAFKIKWDEKIDNKIKFNVLRATIDGYTQAVDEISKAEFGSKLCELDSFSLKELKRKFQFCFLIEKKLPLPPPPPIGTYELVIDSVEPKLETN